MWRLPSLLLEEECFTLITSLSSKEVSEINRNSLKFGRMKTLIKAHKDKKLQTNLYICQYKNPYNKKLIAWAAIEEQDRHLDLHVFVKKKYRNLNIGSKLVRLSKSFQEEKFPNKKLACSPYEKIGKLFFEKFKIKNQKTILIELRS